MQRLMNELKAIIDDAVDNGPVPSISIGIVRGDHLYRYQRGYQTLVPVKTPVTVDTRYDMASVTKVSVTVFLVLKLLEEKIIKLDDPVIKHLTAFRYPDITIHHLLTHTSGLPAEDKRYKSCHDKEELTRFIYDLALTYPTGTAVTYSCFNYILLGFMIEQYKGSIEDYADKVLFGPLGMTDSGFNPGAKGFKAQCAATEVTEQRGVIQGVVHDGKAHILNGIAGNAGLFSTVADLSHLAMMLLDDGVYQNKRCFSPELLALLKTDQTPGLNESRSLGWFYNDPYCQFAKQESVCCLYHTGFTGTSLYIDYDRQCAIILLTNRVHPSRDNDYIQPLRRQLHRMILDYIDNN